MNRARGQFGLSALMLVLVVSSVVWFMLGRPLTGIDDADIFFVYARHFADGHGFVYNVGGEQVEGFTSMLWTLICSGAFCLWEHIEVPLCLLNVLIGCATVYACLKRALNAPVFMILLASSPAWFAWCQLTLMESGLWCLLLTLSILMVAERRFRALAVLLPLLVLTRPESMLWGIWLLLVAGFIAVREQGGEGAKKLIVPLLVFFISLAGLIGFRLYYFGYSVPNTYYAKMSSSLFFNLQHGAIYLFHYLLVNPAHLLLAGTWCFILVRGLRCWKAAAGFGPVIALCLLPGIGIPVVVGGDHFGGFRFYQPLWPLLCLLAVNEWGPRLEQWSRLRRRLLLVVPVLCGWVLFPLTGDIGHEFRIAREGRETGRALAAMFADQETLPSVATITAGGTKFGYPGPVFDVMGLNSTEMAHAPGPRNGFKNHMAFNRDVFYAWHPDILLCGDSAKFDAMVLKGLPLDERFRNEYVKVELRRNGQRIRAYYSYAFLEHLN